jgi:exonuclease VII small subunit
LKKKPTKKEFETVISTLITHVRMLEEKVSALDNMFGIYLRYKQEDERFQKFIHEKLEENINKSEDERAE